MKQFIARAGKWAVAACVAAGLIVAGQVYADSHGEADQAPIHGYTDTPIIPGTPWHVHDPHRPQPAIIEGTSALTTPAPADGIVLFDGSGLDAFMADDGSAAAWTVSDGTMRTNGTGSVTTREAFGDIQLHVEFMAPNPDEGDGQSRGNSGLFFMGQYEVQILDSYQNPTYPDGQAGALYGQEPPLVNASAPAQSWQSYDIVFEAPRFAADGTVISPAFVTVLHNGVLVQNRTAFDGATAHRALAHYTAHDDALPLSIQDHGQEIALRNIWVRKLNLGGARQAP